MECTKCGEKNATLWINGNRVCELCFFGVKHFHFVPYRRVLSKKNLWEKFLHRHPEFTKIDWDGKKYIQCEAITNYLKSDLMSR